MINKTTPEEKAKRSEEFEIAVELIENDPKVTQYALDSLRRFRGEMEACDICPPLIEATCTGGVHLRWEPILPAVCIDIMPNGVFYYNWMFSGKDQNIGYTLIQMKYLSKFFLTLENFEETK